LVVIEMAIQWADIADMVTEALALEGAQPNVGFARLLGNQSLAIISEESQAYERSWDNSADGALTIDGKTITLPDDVLSVTSVEWDEDLLVGKTAAWMDRYYEGWRYDDTSYPVYYILEGNTIILDAVVGPNSVGLLVVRGIGKLPDFSINTSDPNPLAYLPAAAQWAPAYYILANLPADPTNNQAVARQAMYQAKWDQTLASVVSTVLVRKNPGYSGT
jgi:hypothetical protein